MNTNTFQSLNLSGTILSTLAKEGYTTPTEVQTRAIPPLLEGKDLLATAQTGTGKTAAFSLPIIQTLAAGPRSRNIRALILTPTRELAIQIHESIKTYGRGLPVRSTVVMGGVSAGAQIRDLRSGPDVLVATPGRLLDLHNQGYVKLGHVQVFVLDEADRMLDMGFIHDVKKISALIPPRRQTMLFSATMPTEVANLANELLRNPETIAVARQSTVAANIDQRVLFVDQANKKDLLTHILTSGNIQRALVFTRTKHRADRITKQLYQSGISSDAIHSNKSQNARQKALAAFDRGRVRVLVATDIVARGIDVDGITHVINYELPHEPESYVHRIGRTARAGAEGVAMSFCDTEEVKMLRGIEMLTKINLTAMEDQPFHSASIASRHAMGNQASPRTSTKSRSRNSGRSKHGSRNGNGARSGGGYKGRSTSYDRPAANGSHAPRYASTDRPMAGGYGANGASTDRPVHGGYNGRPASSDRPAGNGSHAPRYAATDRPASRDRHSGGARSNGGYKSYKGRSKGSSHGVVVSHAAPATSNGRPAPASHGHRPAGPDRTVAKEFGPARYGRRERN